VRRLEQSGSFDLNFVQIVDFRLASLPGRRLVVMLCRRAAHGSIGIPEEIARILIHVMLFGDIRALNGAVFESKVGPTLHCRTANVSEELRTNRIGSLGAGA